MSAQTAAKMRDSPPTAAECSAETDSALEEAGFELLVPPLRSTALPELAPFVFRARLHRLRSLVSENDDFELPGSHSNLARRAT